MKRAEKCLEIGFEGIKKYYHVMTMNENDNQMHIYDFIDKYIDFNFKKSHIKKVLQFTISSKTIDLVKNEKSDEIKLEDKTLSNVGL